MITYQSLLHTRVKKSVKILRRAKKIREIYYLSSASPKIKISKSYQFLRRHESNGWWREGLITNRMLGTKNNPFLCHSRYNTSRRYDSKWTEMRSSSWYPPYVRFKYNNCALFSRGVDRTAIYQAFADAFADSRSILHSLSLSSSLIKRNCVRFDRMKFMSNNIYIYIKILYKVLKMKKNVKKKINKYSMDLFVLIIDIEKIFHFGMDYCEFEIIGIQLF